MSPNEMMTKALEAGRLNESTAGSLKIFASVVIQAEVQRILYALSTTEYMGAWLQLLCAERIECHSEQRSFDRIRIDMFSLNGRGMDHIAGRKLPFEASSRGVKRVDIAVAAAKVDSVMPHRR
jgi:hypothetical protein